jgi:hypothetical protein
MRYYLQHTCKPPGHDGIPNEIMKFLAQDTCLLHKKGDPTLLDIYRPIALMNNLLKLWIALLI